MELDKSGNLQIKGVLRPGTGTSPPVCNAIREGALYYDTDGGTGIGGLYICNGHKDGWELIHPCAN